MSARSLQHENEGGEGGAAPLCKRGRHAPVACHPKVPLGPCHPLVWCSSVLPASLACTHPCARMVTRARRRTPSAHDCRVGGSSPLWMDRDGDDGSARGLTPDRSRWAGPRMQLNRDPRTTKLASRARLRPHQAPLRRRGAATGTWPWKPDRQSRRYLYLWLAVGRASALSRCQHEVG